MEKNLHKDQMQQANKATKIFNIRAGKMTQCVKAVAVQIPMTHIELGK